MKFYICLPCLEQKGGTNKVVEELEKLPMPQQAINFKKNDSCNQNATTRPYLLQIQHRA